MQRLARFDISQNLRTPASRAAGQIVFGLVCAMAMIGLRSVIDVVAPTSGPFALVYPTVLIATLFGHWRGGVAALILSFFWAWYIVLETPYSFAFAQPSDPARVAINFLSCLVVVVFAEAFRRAVRTNSEWAERELARRQVLMADLEHRTKNNFQLVASLLSIQKARDPAPGLSAALDDAINRVRTFADAYATLKLDTIDDSDVEMDDYLARLARRVGEASLPPDVTLHVDVAPMSLPREKAVAIGLFVNEALSNCGKYAFFDGRGGSVTVTLAGDADNWALEVRDDGAGRHAVAASRAGLGSDLFAAFASQAEAEHLVEIMDVGARAALAARRADMQEE